MIDPSSTSTKHQQQNVLASTIDNKQRRRSTTNSSPKTRSRSTIEERKQESKAMMRMNTSGGKNKGGCSSSASLVAIKFIIIVLLVLSTILSAVDASAAAAAASTPSTLTRRTKAAMSSLVTTNKSHYNKKKKKQCSTTSTSSTAMIIRLLSSPLSLSPVDNHDACSNLVIHTLRGGAAATAAAAAKTTPTKKSAAAAAATVSVSAAAAAAVAAPPASSSTLLLRLKVGFYFALWYALNIVYNILNKKVLNTWPAPLTVGTMQFGVGCLYANVIWMLQLRGKRPQVFNSQPIHAVGFWHAAGQLTSMISLGAGPVSFTHIVKALEPFFSAIVSVVVFGQGMHPVVYATLLPVVGGVGYACLKERSFSWLAFWMAMASNVAFALRAVLSKVAMSSSSSSSSSIGTNLTPTNVFGLVTESAFWISIPIALLGEGLGIRQSWADATKIQNGVDLLKAIFVSGFFHYINNEVMYLALDSVHPVTLAVGNTMKRIFIMVASVMVFRNEITTQAAIGSAIGIGGVLLYSLTKQHYEKLATSSPSAASSSVLAKGSKKVNSTAKAKAAIVATNKGKKDEKKR